MGWLSPSILLLQKLSSRGILDRDDDGIDDFSISRARLDLPDAGKLRKRRSKISIWSKPPLIAFSYSPLFVFLPPSSLSSTSSRKGEYGRAYIFRGKYKFSKKIRDSGLAWATRRWKRGAYNNCVKQDSIQWIIECEKSRGKILIPFVLIERVR